MDDSCLIDEASEGQGSHVVQMGPCRAGAEQISSPPGLYQMRGLFTVICLVGTADEVTRHKGTIHLGARTIGETSPAHPPPPGLLQEARAD